jgi:nucleoside-diphosphate-sugar epimerase
MNIFLTGANGFIGGAVASALRAEGHTVRGLVRDEAKAAAVRPHGIVPVLGALDDAALLEREVRAADAIVNAASSDHAGAVDAILRGRAGTTKPFLHTSGSSVVADEAMGEPSERIFHEDTPLAPVAEKVARVALDARVRDAGGIVLCCTMVYGEPLGAPSSSVQVPRLVEHAKASGVARFIGRGLNRWSNVHIADVASLYPLVLARGEPGSFLYVESGEESLGAIVRAIGAKLGLPAASWSQEEASAAWGRELAVFALGSNSRVRGERAAKLGWRPQRRSIISFLGSEP